MPQIYSYTFTETGEGPWWGIRCSKLCYQGLIRQMNETDRCFVSLTNSIGETLAIAVEGPYSDEVDNAVFVPGWVLTRLGLYDGETIVLEPILHTLPRGLSVKLKPVTKSTVEGPMFIEGLTEALNQLGVVQEGVLSAIIDPSVPELHEFIIENLEPARVCLADGELHVDIQPAVDDTSSGLNHSPVPQNEENIANKYDFDEDEPMISDTVNQVSSKSFIPFGGTGYRLDGKI